LVKKSGTLYFMSSQKKIFRSVFKMGSATFLSRILGLVREQMIAWYFGAGLATDAFNVAFRIPNLLRDLLAEGAFSSAFVPLFTEKVQKEGRTSSIIFVQQVFTALLFLTAIIVTSMVVFAPELIDLFAPGFQENTGQREMAIVLLRVMSPYLLCVSIAALFMGVLNTEKMFFIPAMAPVIFNIVSILGMFVLIPWLVSLGLPTIYSLGISVVVGGIGQCLIQWPFMRRAGFIPRFHFSFFTPEVKKIFHRVGLGTFGAAATQLNILVNTILATQFTTGAVSWLNYACRLFQFPVGILSVSMAGGHLVYFSEAWKGGHRSEAMTILRGSLGWSFFILAPISTITYVCAPEIVAIVFQRGAFSISDTLATAQALQAYSLGLIAYGLFKILSPTFYVLDRPKVPVFVSFFSVSGNIAWSYLVARHVGHHFLALGTTLAVSVSAIAQLVILKKMLEVRWRDLFPLSGIVLCSVMFAIIWLYEFFFHGLMPSVGFWNSMGQALIKTVICVVIFGIIAWPLGMKKAILARKKKRPTQSDKKQ
jgi:putative peptidoglycan lipid II flippase